MTDKEKYHLLARCVRSVVDSAIALGLELARKSEDVKSVEINKEYIHRIVVYEIKQGLVDEAEIVRKVFKRLRTEYVGGEL